jgi:hypothetical protein
VWKPKKQKEPADLHVDWKTIIQDRMVFL